MLFPRKDRGNQSCWRQDPQPKQASHCTRSPVCQNTETKEEAMNGTDSRCLPERIAFCPPCRLQALWAAGLRLCPAPSSVFGPSQPLNTTLLVFTVGLRKGTQETVGSFPKALCHRQSQSTDPEKYSSP